MVEVVPYDPKWPDIFKEISAKIRLAIKGCLAVYHVGSTAVEGLAAKPKIDVIAEVEDLGFDDKGLLALGYRSRGGFGLPLRKSYTCREGVAVNLHVFEKGDPEISLNLLFLEYLKTHPEDKAAYQSLKYQLLEEEDSHHKKGRMYVGYTLKKHDFIQSILKKAGFKGERFVIASHDQEIQDVKSFGYAVLEDHTYLLLYQGFKAVACAELKDKVVGKIECDVLYQDRFNALIEKYLSIV